MKKCYLVLADGHIFEGFRFGAEGKALGELVFNTGVVGYEAVLTDPNNFGQIVLQTFPMIGNYGIISEDVKDKSAYLNGYVVREYCTAPSNFRCDGTLDEYLKEQGVVGIYGVDTREITRIIRDKGVMNAVIVDDPSDIEGLADYTVTNAMLNTSRGARDILAPEGEAACRVAVYDCGNADSLCEHLVKRGCEVHVFPCDAKADLDVLACNPDGIMLSDGPGDPTEYTRIIEEVKKLLGVKPIFAVGMGHQILAIASGAKTYKLQYGHRGGNQPVKDLSTRRTYITTQNHGYAVDASSLVNGASERFVNANDHTCEGVSYDALNAFSVQFHPAVCGGPQDTSFLYDSFVKLMESAR